MPLTFCFLISAPFVWGSEEEHRERSRSVEHIGSSSIEQRLAEAVRVAAHVPPEVRVPASPVRSPGLARLGQLVRAHPNFARQHEEASAQEQEEEDSKPAARPEGRLPRAEEVVDLPAPLGPVAPFAAAARSEVQGSGRGVGRRRAVPPPVPPRPVPAQPPATPKTVGLFPIGPRDTGKSVLMNLAAMLSVYCNGEVLVALDHWYSAQYPAHFAEGGSRVNPFGNAVAVPGGALPEVLEQSLSRFVSVEGLEEMLRSDVMVRWLREFPPRAYDLIREYAEQDVPEVSALLMPATRWSKYRFADVLGAEGASEVSFLYADDMLMPSTWRLVVGNKKGWELWERDNNDTLPGERPRQEQISMMEQVRERLFPTDIPPIPNEEQAEQIRLSAFFGKHFFFQLRAVDLEGGAEDDEDQNYLLEVVGAMKYTREHTNLPILLVVSYASELPERRDGDGVVQPFTAARVVHIFEEQGVPLVAHNIFFFELGGMLDLPKPEENEPPARIHHQFNAWLATEGGHANLIERYFRAQGRARGAVLAEIMPRLSQLATALRRRWAKNLAMMHQLLKRVYDVQKGQGVEGEIDRARWDRALQRGLRYKYAEQRAAYVRIHKTTRQCISIRGIDFQGGGLDAHQLHFVRLFKYDGRVYPGAARAAAVLSYEASLRHEARGIERDEIFVPARDLDERIRRSYLWRPINPPTVNRHNGVIVHDHGTLKTITHPGLWLFFDLGREEYTERKQSRIRDFEDARVVDQNTLRGPWEALQAVAPARRLPRQVAWLVLNTDLSSQEVVRQQVHEEQRDRLLQARNQNVRTMVRYLTGGACTEEQL